MGGLWTSNGFTAGTHFVQDSPASPQKLIAAGNKLFFTGNDGVHGNTLWVYDQGVGVRSYTLVNAETNEDVVNFWPDDASEQENAVELDLTGLPHPERINIRVNTFPPVVGSVGIGLDGDNYGHEELAPPYAFFGDGNGHYKAWQDVLPRDMGGSCAPAGGHLCDIAVEAVAGNWDAGNYSNSFYFKLKYDDIRVESFTLVNALTNTDIQQLHQNDVIDLSTLPTTKLNIRANTNPPTVGSVIFDGIIGVVEDVAPYALFGDRNGDYNNWQAVPGNYRLQATPYSKAQGDLRFSDVKGVCGIPLSLSFQLIQSGAHKTDGQADDEFTAPTALQVFPNPNEGSFNVSFTVEETTDVKVEVYDLLGKTVYHDELQSFSGAYSRRLDLSMYGQGIYLLKVQEGGETPLVKKITVNF